MQVVQGGLLARGVEEGVEIRIQLYRVDLVAMAGGLDAQQLGFDVIETARQQMEGEVQLNIGAGQGFAIPVVVAQQLQQEIPVCVV